MRSTDRLSTATSWPSAQALAHDVVDAEPLLAVEEVGQALPEHRHPAGDRAVVGEPHELDGLHGPVTLARAAGVSIPDVRTGGRLRQSLISSGPSGTSMRIRLALDDDVIDRQRQLGRRIERLAVLEIEARQVERAGERAGRQEALVELEVLVAADALDRGQVAVGVDRRGPGPCRPPRPSSSCRRGPRRPPRRSMRLTRRRWFPRRCRPPTWPRAARAGDPGRRPAGRARRPARGSRGR